MDAAQIQQRTQQLSADDGDIRQALDVLEGKLEAWFEAYSTLAEPEPVIEQPVEPEAPKGLLVQAEAPEAETETENEPEPETEHAAAPAAVMEEVEQESTAEDADAERRREEDESLLNTLDPEVATAIRIKRRLGDGRSVRELLDEYEQEQEAGKNESQRKRWWR